MHQSLCDETSRHAPSVLSKPAISSAEVLVDDQHASISIVTTFRSSPMRPFENTTIFRNLPQA